MLEGRVSYAGPDGSHPQGPIKFLHRLSPSRTPPEGRQSTLRLSPPCLCIAVRNTNTYNMSKQQRLQKMTQCQRFALVLRKRLPPTRVKIAKIRKRGFRGQKTPISQCPRHGRFDAKIPIFHVEPCREMWIF